MLKKVTIIIVATKNNMDIFIVAFFKKKGDFHCFLTLKMKLVNIARSVISRKPFPMLDKEAIPYSPAYHLTEPFF